MKKILVADDHPILRNGIIHLLKANARNIQVYEAGDGKEALDIILNKKPDVAFLDIDMPHIRGIEVCRRAIRSGSETKMIILTMHREEYLFNEAMDEGAKSFLLKDNAMEEIVTCLTTVLKGETYISPDIVSFLENRKNKKLNIGSEQDLTELLTGTELKILKLIAQGKTSQQIADLHFISVRTVDNHRSNICKKLDLKGNNALLMFVTSHAKILQ